MAFSKARRLGDLITANAEQFITSAHITDTAITGSDIHSTFDLTGKTVTVATASAGDNDTSVASTAFVQQEIASLVDSAPGTLNTLNELAAALGDDASFSTTVTNSIATKAPLASPSFTGNVGIGESSPDEPLTVDGDIKIKSTNKLHFTNTSDQTSIHAPASNTIAFSTNSSEKMRLDTSGNLLLGATSTNFGAFSNSTSPQLLVAGTMPQVALHETDTDKDGYIGISGSTMFIQTADAIPMRFGTSDAERMRIASNGKVFINETNTGAYGGLGHLVLKQTADDLGIGVIDDGENNTFKFINNGTYAKIAYNAALPIRVYTSDTTQQLEISNTGAIKSASGGMVLQTKEAYESTQYSVSSNSTQVVVSLSITIKEASKIVAWFHSGQILMDGNSMNPNGHIQWVNSSGTVGNISDHNGNHYWWDASTHIDRRFVTHQGMTGELTAGTYTVRFLAGNYGGDSTWNYQNKGAHLIVQEIAAN